MTQPTQTSSCSACAATRQPAKRQEEGQSHRFAPSAWTRPQKGRDEASETSLLRHPRQCVSHTRPLQPSTWRDGSHHLFSAGALTPTQAGAPEAQPRDGARRRHRLISSSLGHDIKIQGRYAHHPCLLGGQPTTIRVVHDRWAAHPPPSWPLFARVVAGGSRSAPDSSLDLYRTLPVEANNTCKPVSSVCWYECQPAWRPTPIVPGSWTPRLRGCGASPRRRIG